MITRLTAVVAVCALPVLASCRQPESSGPVLVDPHSAEFVQRRDDVVRSAVELEARIAAAASSAVEPDPAQQVVCRAGNRGPKGVDAFDSVCGMQRLSVVKTADPGRALLAIDDALGKLGYTGTWQGGTEPIDKDDVRSGKVPSSRISFASYGAGGLTVDLQVGHRGDRPSYVVRTSLGTGYFNDAGGSGWAAAGAQTAPLAESVLAVTVTDPAFIEKPPTDGG
ncbi:hypothetical protein [Kribbella sp. NPDC003557]|uniref:hypothetical protein n=1 Tax=Kribbella sp. NPDC003557 TaxID=3154449 RepID=UPI0033BE1CB6